MPCSVQKLNHSPYLPVSPVHALCNLYLYDYHVSPRLACYVAAAQYSALLLPVFHTAGGGGGFPRDFLPIEITWHFIVT